MSSVNARDLSYNQLTGEIPFNIGFLQVATLYVLHDPSSYFYENDIWSFTFFVLEFLDRFA